jgi:hypothetical protein
VDFHSRADDSKRPRISFHHSLMKSANLRNLRIKMVRCFGSVAKPRGIIGGILFHNPRMRPRYFASSGPLCSSPSGRLELT